MNVKTGDNVGVGVAPGWIFAGRVESVTEGEVALSPAVYVESLSAPWFTAANDPKKITKYAPIARISLMRSAILWHSPCAESVVAIAATDAIRGAK